MAFSVMATSASYAQDQIPSPDEIPEIELPDIVDKVPERDPDVDTQTDGKLKTDDNDESDIGTDPDSDFDSDLDAGLDEDLVDEVTPIPKKSYAHLPPEAEKAARLEDLFAKLKLEDDETSANLVAEEIWAVWLDSGSASIDLVLRRATASDKKNDDALARRLFDHVTKLRPEYAEGWSRSGRLAFEDKDYNRAVVEITKALQIEPRHFYALWTMGNLLENLNRQDEALAFYKKANEIYPAMKVINDRMSLLEGYIDGDVL